MVVGRWEWDLLRILAGVSLYTLVVEKGTRETICL